MKNIRGVLKTVLLLALTFSFAQPLFAEGNDSNRRKTVRVGYFIGEGFQEKSEIDGHRSGYCYEYFQTLSDYTGWQYEYVETSWAGALEKIAKGEIDILAQASKTEERQKFMLYADHPMGAEDYYLYVLPNKNKKLRSDNVSTLNGAKVGVNAGSYQLLSFIEWCEENDVHCEIIESEDEDARVEQFFNGELDAIVDNDFYLDQGWLPLFKIGKSNYYMCVTMSRPDLYEELNVAQTKLFENAPLYIEKLQAKYFPHDVATKTLNNRESEWLERRLKTKGSIKLGYLNNYLPYCNYNEETGGMEGVVTVFIDTLKGLFDVEVKAVPFDDRDVLYESVRKSEIDACFPFYDMLWQSEELGIMQTDAFVEYPMAYVFRKGEYNESKSEKKFAVAKTRQMQSAYIRDKHPGSQIIFYDDYKNCMDAIAKGEVDGMYINSFILSIIFDLYQAHPNLDIVYLPKNASFCFGVSIDSCPELLTIFNKNIALIDDSVKTSYLVRNTQTEQKFSIRNFFHEYALSIVIIVLVVSSLIIAFFWYQARRLRLAQMHERESRIAAHEAFEAANKANAAKTEFLSSMSHDIRTPMNAIVGMTAIAAANLNNTEKVKHCLTEITTSSKHLLGLINEVLDMNKIELGKLSLSETEFNLVKLVNDFVSIIKPLAQEREHTFVLDVHDIKHENVIGDAERIQQCFMNFMSNAIKYTPKGGNIKLSVTEKETGRPKIGCYEFTVEDNGIGMSEDFVKIMFDPFVRADDKRVAGQQGTGLGMSITKNIINMMDGDIKVESHLNQGTAITTTVYLAFKEDGSEPLAENNKIADLQKFREVKFQNANVLLVEDNEINAEIATEILEMTGIKVDHAVNGQEAIEKLSNITDNYYKIIFMDIQMPVMNGFEAVQKIRASEREYLQKVPIIAMSANAFAEDVEKSKSVGMDEHIAKPLDFDNLLQLLNRFLQ